MFQTLAGPATLLQEIKKSRFLAFAAPVTGEDEAREFLDTHRDPSANHNCWAYRLGQAYRFSDDGEPSGTAGKPILQAIDGQGLDGVVVLVTRWFGGILLGSGGLMRAYGGTAAECLRQAEKIEIIAKVDATADIAFSDLARVKAKLAAFRDLTFVEDFNGTGAVLAVSMRQEDRAAVSALITDLTSGRSRLRFPDDEPEDRR